MLWNSVFEFFVRYVFGGVLSINGQYTSFGGSLGWLGSQGGGQPFSTADMYVIRLYFSEFDNPYNVSLGNYLSLIATIITMVIIVTLCSLFIWKIVKLIGGLIR